MNYLAHLYFSAPTPLAWAGSLMGDFVKGPVPADLPRELTQYLILHRKVDSYTQRSPAFQRSRERLDARFRYARAILVDVFYDHFLARHWDHYHHRPLADFSAEVYAGLQSCFELLPGTLQQQLPLMIEYDWLTSYRRPEVVLRVLQRLQQRLCDRFPLAQGVDELERCRAGLEDDFSLFMQEMKVEMPNWISVR